MTEAPGILHLLAFAAEPGGGNPAGVVLDATALAEADMRRIATDLGYPETAYVVARHGRRLRVRYFSPDAEVPFCGHATIATAVALAEAEGPGEFVFETVAGDVAVSAVDDEVASPRASPASSRPFATFPTRRRCSRCWGSGPTTSTRGCRSRRPSPVTGIR